MAEPQLSVRSARARSLAHKLAKKEQRTVSQVVERALEAYAKLQQGPRKETAAEFWDRMHRDYGGEPDIDLDAIIREGRIDHSDPIF